MAMGKLRAEDQQLSFRQRVAFAEAKLTETCEWRYLAKHKKGYPMKHNEMAIDVRTRIIYSALTIMTIMFSMGKELMAQTNTSTVVKNIVLVHGGFVDGSGW